MPNTEAAQFWNERFKTEDFIFGVEPNEYLKEKASEFLKANQNILCVADGEGRNSVYLAKQGLSVDAFDVSDVAVEKARGLAQKAKVQVNFSIEDCDTWSWTPNQYDAVLAIFVQFADPQMRQRLFENLQETLKPGGILVLLGYTQKQLEYKTGGPVSIEYLYTEDMLKMAFSEMKILELQSYEKELSEGARHRGMSALVGMVARKI